MMSDVYFVSFIIESHLDAIRLEAIAIRSRFLEKLNTPFRWQYEPCKPFDQTLRQQRRSSIGGSSNGLLWCSRQKLTRSG